MGAKYRRTTGSRRPLGLSAFYSLNDTQWRRDDELREWPSGCPANDANDLGAVQRASRSISAFRTLLKRSLSPASTCGWEFMRRIELGDRLIEERNAGGNGIRPAEPESMKIVNPTRYSALRADLSVLPKNAGQDPQARRYFVSGRLSEVRSERAEAGKPQ